MAELQSTSDALTINGDVRGRRVSDALPRVLPVNVSSAAVQETSDLNRGSRRARSTEPDGVRVAETYPFNGITVSTGRPVGGSPYLQR